jgi:hypothetical protein
MITPTLPPRTPRKPYKPGFGTTIIIPWSGVQIPPPLPVRNPARPPRGLGGSTVLKMMARSLGFGASDDVPRRTGPTLDMTGHDSASQEGFVYRRVVEAEPTD